jgi:predicted nucleotidyltransferase component of viral defense system
MEKEIDHKRLYDLQDEVLRLVSKLENPFYLTGGTALHRFYYNARYSDDLDFFVSHGVNFKEDIDEIINSLQENGYQTVIDVAVRDFYRATINDMLQLDFVNDRVYRYGKSKMINGIRVDNKFNILTNKINTIVNRDEEKDVFDLFCLAYNEVFDWQKILNEANKKAVIEKDIFLYRLKSFPLEWLQRIKKIKDIEITGDDIETLCSDVMEGRSNSLVGKNI